MKGLQKLLFVKLGRQQKIKRQFYKVKSSLTLQYQYSSKNPAHLDLIIDLLCNISNCTPVKHLFEEHVLKRGKWNVATVPVALNDHEKVLIGQIYPIAVWRFKVETNGDEEDVKDILRLVPPMKSFIEYIKNKFNVEYVDFSPEYFDIIERLHKTEEEFKKKFELPLRPVAYINKKENKALIFVKFVFKNPNEF